MSKYLFKTGKTVTMKKQERVFDIVLDYEYYFPDFLKYGINLNKQDIDWWEFDKILNAILLDKNSNMYQIISFRTYEKTSKNIKINEEKEHKYRSEMKRKYSLLNKNQIENGLDKLWKYVEKKASDSKEE